MDVVLSPFDALKAAVDKAGSQSELARILDVSQAAVWKWLQSSKQMPAHHVLATEAATGISRHDLRPDIYPREESPAHPPATQPLPAGGSSASLERAQA